MSRRIRFIPPGGALVEVTTRTIQGRALLCPGRQINDIIVGVLARGQKRTAVELCAVTFMSTHYHLLLWVKDAQQLATFMGFVNGNLAKEVNRLIGWDAKVWGDRYHAIVISDEEEAQVNRLRYVLAQGCKDHLVEHAQDWPGVNSTGALIEGVPLEGHWFNRTEESKANRRGEDFGHYEYATAETLFLASLPCWRDLPEEEWRAHVASLVEGIEADAVQEREHLGIEPLAPERIRRQDPFARPAHLKRSPAPDFHAATSAVRETLRKAYAWFVAAYREAAATFRAGDTSAVFPAGCFPPSLPFVEPAMVQPP